MEETYSKINQSLLCLHQLLAQSLPCRRSSHACVYARVHVVGRVENCTGILHANADKENIL